MATMLLKVSMTSSFTKALVFVIFLQFINVHSTRLADPKAASLPALPEDEPLEHFTLGQQPGTSTSTGTGIRQPVSVTNLVRGQDGKLIPVGTGDLLDLSPKPQLSAAETFRLLRNAAAQTTNPTFSSNEGMQQLLKEEPHLNAQFDGSVEPDTADLGRKYLAVEVSNKDHAKSVFARVQQEKKPFYVREPNGKVWFFSTDDGKSFLVTDQTRPEEQEIINTLPGLKPQARLQPSTSAEPANRMVPSRMERSNEAAHLRSEDPPATEATSAPEDMEMMATTANGPTLDRVSGWKTFTREVKNLFSQRVDLTIGGASTRPEVAALALRH